MPPSAGDVYRAADGAEAEVVSVPRCDVTGRTLVVYRAGGADRVTTVSGFLGRYAQAAADPAPAPEPNAGRVLDLTERGSGH